MGKSGAYSATLMEDELYDLQHPEQTQAPLILENVDEHVKRMERTIQEARKRHPDLFG